MISFYNIALKFYCFSLIDDNINAVMTTREHWSEVKHIAMIFFCSILNANQSVNNISKFLLLFSLLLIVYQFRTMTNSRIRFQTSISTKTPYLWPFCFLLKNPMQHRGITNSPLTPHNSVNLFLKRK